MFKNPFRKKESQPKQSPDPEILVPHFLRNSSIAISDSEIIVKYFENIFAKTHQEIIGLDVYDIAELLRMTDVKNNPNELITSLEAFNYWSRRVKMAMDVIFLFRQENGVLIIDGETVNVQFLKSAIGEDAFWVRFTKIDCKENTENNVRF